MRIIPENELRLSPVVANCSMNRKRKLLGINSYQKEIGMDIEAYLESKQNDEPIRWLDICCGEGNALIELANRLNQSKQDMRIELVGIDLVSMFNSYNPLEFANLKLISCAFEDWDSPKHYDLITCIHGLHYIGDKLGVLQKIGRLLKVDGQFYGNLDLKNVLARSVKPMDKWLKQVWKEMDWNYHTRKKMLVIDGRKDFVKQWEYLGADDQAGPNYTGQEAVNSYYDLID